MKQHAGVGVGPGGLAGTADPSKADMHQISCLKVVGNFLLFIGIVPLPMEGRLL